MRTKHPEASRLKYLLKLAGRLRATSEWLKKKEKEEEEGDM